MIDNQEKEKGCDSMVVTALQEDNNSGQVEPRTGGNKGIACGVAQEKGNIDVRRKIKQKYSSNTVFNIFLDVVFLFLTFDLFKLHLISLLFNFY